MSECFPMMSKLTSHYPNWLWLCWTEGCLHVTAECRLRGIAHLQLVAPLPIHTSDCMAVQWYDHIILYMCRPVEWKILKLYKPDTRGNRNESAVKRLDMISQLRRHTSVKPVYICPEYSGHPVYNGHWTTSQKSSLIFTVKLTCIKRSLI